MAARKKITFVQVLTIVMIILAIVWEKNMQQWFAANPDKTDISRVDLFVIVPLLATLIAVSLYQWRQNNKKTE
ncbi:MAG: hypothetical protein ABNH00_02030 [Dokdonia sp.]|jgi:uncharacterized membrane protein